MAIHKLFLFSKNTDANASIRGYNYQTLKTVETWLSNSIHKKDEEIYCDFEDDIFQHGSKKLKFRQLKLYSSNFSFKSEEIEKCISHFFLLHIKSEYASTKKEFVFETNSRVANKYLDNDADLLREWWQNQGSLSRDLLKRCCDKVKQIVSEYIKGRYEELKKTVEEKLLNEALTIYQNLKESDWSTFVNLIRWHFTSKSSDEEFANTISKIENLLLEHPVPIGKEKLDAAFGILYKEASLKASDPEPKNRKLTNRLLDRLLLTISGEEDKWYSEVYFKWQDQKAHTSLHMGEFYEVLRASRFCRRNVYLKSHDKTWLKILLAYIELPEIPINIRHKAIYEYLWLQFRPDDNFKLPTGTLKGSEELIFSYFYDFDAFENAEAIEDAQTLLHITFTAMMSKKVSIEAKQIIFWFKELYRAINKHLRNSENPNEKCHLLEELGIFKMFTGQRKPGAKDQGSFISPFNQILEILDSADLYHASLLSDRINKYIDLFIKIDAEKHSALISLLEEFSQKLDVQVLKREGKYKRAKQQVERGVAYIHSKNPDLLLKAFTYFHEAKDLYHHKETIEGYILALVNISQLYSAINMNLAAKYYAIGAAWVSVHNGDEKLYKRIADAFAMLFHTDFKQGAWISALSDFELYFKSKQEFDTRPVFSDDDPTPFRMMSDLAMILYALPALSEQFRKRFDEFRSGLGYVDRDFLKPTINFLEKEFPDKNSLEKYLQERLDDYPGSDAGMAREITFNALGCDWLISFKNDYNMNSISEEFCSVLQIMLTEIYLSGTDFHFPKSKVNLELELSSSPKQPEPIPSNTEYKWKIFLCHFDSPKPIKINEHFASITAPLMFILNEISLLPYQEFKTLFAQLFIKNALAKKALIANSYQRIFRYLIPESLFGRTERHNVNPFSPEMRFPKPNHVIPWRADLSAKYDQARAIQHIKNRFKNSLPSIHITLSRLKPQLAFRELIKRLRAAGWLDWQIILAIMNFIINYKVRLEARTKSFSGEEDYVSFMKEAFFRYSGIDEKTFYVEFPVEAFETEEFMMGLQNGPMNVLNAINLEYKARFPNFPAVAEFLNVRFNMNRDFSDEGNPLRDI